MVVAGDKAFVKFVTEKDENIMLKEIKEKIEELSKSNQNHEYQNFLSSLSLQVGTGKLPERFCMSFWKLKDLVKDPTS